VGGGAAIVVPPQAAAVAVARGVGRDEEERGGKGLLADDADPLRPAAARDDWAVDDFNRRTRRAPVPLVLTVLGDMPGMTPPGPGRAG
jgi:hypothetical protein